MKIDRAGYPFIAAAMVPALGLTLLEFYAWALPLLGVGAALVFFFRDPDRQTPESRGRVIAPADGRIMVAGPPQPGAAPPGAWAQVSIFLSPLDVHVNRIPVSGRVARVDYRKGGYRAAYRPEATVENERNEIWIEGETGTVVCRQVTGVLVRRVVCRVRSEDHVRAGDRFGIMKFGSRIDLFVPPEARLLVGVGDRVLAGETPIADLP
jgi:phosphatidylserine decarboxylase